MLALAQGTQTILDRPPRAAPAAGGAPAPVDAHSPASTKVALIRQFFRGREDVFALRWESARTGKAGYSPAVAGGWGAGRPDRPRLPLTDEVVEEHLLGRTEIGVYPLLEDDTCWFLACDFDGKTWMLDVLAFLESCAEADVPAALERSRSGDGAHVWIFFSEPVAATDARRLGALLLRETMARRAEVDLASYDRLFPNQDFLPQRGFGNLIALPLQGKCRSAGTSVFLDPATLEPWPDQWAFLSSLERLSAERLERILAQSSDEAVGPAALAHSVGRDARMPAEVRCSISADLAIPKAGLPPVLLAELKHLASLHNPLFYERQRLRLSTHQTPRLIRCYEEGLTHLRLPRGLLQPLTSAVEAAGSSLIIQDDRRSQERISFEFSGSLTALQETALQQMLAQELGVLVAPPGMGKTVIACAAIAARRVPTLVLVHRKPLLEQWRSQLEATLGLTRKEIGQVGGGRRRRTRLVDLAMIQSLKAIDDLEEFFSGYSLIVIDECHHLPAFSFEACVRRARSRYFLGLTATPYRRDGLQEIITMQCGPIRHRISTDEGPAAELTRELRVRETSLAFDRAIEAPIQEVFRLLVEDEKRAALVCDDVIAALAEGRRCLVLSQWREHCRLLADGLEARGVTPFVLEGGLGKRARAAIIERIESTPSSGELVVVATGQYLGEGFDCPQLDTLFLAFPVAFKGRLVQYTGRLMRIHEGKASVRVYDYSDTHVPVLRKMHTRRLATYKSLGFARAATTPIAAD